jgi:hypothetical protein
MTYGEPHSVSAIIAFGRERANPKSATLSIGTPRGCPLANSSAEAGFKRRFWDKNIEMVTKN